MVRTKTPASKIRLDRGQNDIVDKPSEVGSTKMPNLDSTYTYVIIHAVVCRSVAFCYFVAFSSLYVQYDGLFGVDGLEPARAFLSRAGREGELSNLLPFHKTIGVDVDTMADIICICGLHSVDSLTLEGVLD